MCASEFSFLYLKPISLSTCKCHLNSPDDQCNYHMNFIINVMKTCNVINRKMLKTDLVNLSTFWCLFLWRAFCVYDGFFFFFFYQVCTVLLAGTKASIMSDLAVTLTEILADNMLSGKFCYAASAYKRVLLLYNIVFSD